MLTVHSHSCEPNLAVCHVYWDSPPEVRTDNETPSRIDGVNLYAQQTCAPHLAVVVLRDIEAQEELTLDYHPGKGNKEWGDSLKECCCGAASCRGWIEV
jgi:SET domain-containing protein